MRFSRQGRVGHTRRSGASGKHADIGTDLGKDAEPTVEEVSPKITRYRKRLCTVSYRVILDVPWKLVLFVSRLLTEHRCISALGREPAGWAVTGRRLVRRSAGVIDHQDAHGRSGRRRSELVSRWRLRPGDKARCAER